MYNDKYNNIAVAIRTEPDQAPPEASRSLAYSTKSSSVDGHAARRPSRFSGGTDFLLYGRKNTHLLCRTSRTSRRSYAQTPKTNARIGHEDPLTIPVGSTHHLPGVFADALATSLIEEVEPPLSVLIPPPFLCLSHVDVFIICSRRYMRDCTML